MDNDSPNSRVERTFWTVWYYITGAFNRFLRPEPTSTVRNDPSSFQESAVDSEPANCGHAEGDAGRRGVDEEQPLATDSLLSSSQPIVAWELCTTDIYLGHEEETAQYKTQLSEGSESRASEDDEGMGEEHFAQIGNDDEGLLVAEDKQEEDGVQKLDTRGQDETQENFECEEGMNNQSLRLTGDAMIEKVEDSGRKDGAEEETEREVTPDDHQNMDENLTKIKVIVEEDDKIHHENEQDLEAEDTEVKLCTSLEEEDNMNIEEIRVQRDAAETAVTHEEVEDSDGVLLLASDNDNKSDEGARQVCEELSDEYRDFNGDPSLASVHVELEVAYDKSGIVSEDELIVVAQEHVMAHRSETDIAEDAKEDESTSDEREQGPVIEVVNVNEAANDQTTDDVPEQKNDIKSVTEDSQEEDISTRRVTHREEVVNNPQTELHTAEFTNGNQEDVAREADDVETDRHGEVIDGKSDMTATDISVDERFFDKDQVEERERLSSEVGDKESYMEVACITTSVTVKPGQEISGEFKNIPHGIGEGQLVVSRELNSPICEETHEGVPDYNNEPGPDENTTQRFLEVGDCEEIQITQLPEEVESKEPKILQNSGCSTGADYLLVGEHIEEDQESTDDIKNSFDLVAEEPAGILCFTDAGLSQDTEKPLVEPVIQESGLLFEEEEGKLSVGSMKTRIEHSEKEFEMHVGLSDETDKTTKELQDGTEELLVELEINEGLCESKEADDVWTGTVTAGEVVGFADEPLTFLDTEVQKMAETSFFQVSVDAIKSEQNSNMTPGLLEDFTESGFLKQLVETEPKLPEDITVGIQDAGIDVEETHYGVEEEAAEEDEVQNKNEMEILNQQVAGMAAELTTERNEKENTSTAESGSLETPNQLSDEAPEISNEETEAADESMTSDPKPKDLNIISAEEMAKHVTESDESYAEERVSPISGHQDVIDEEILDLWLQTALSEDTDGIKQEEEPEQQMDTDIRPANEEQDEISSVQTEKDKKQLVESNSGESELLSDTEMSSSTAESGFLDHSLSEWGTQNSETQLPKSTSSGSFQGIYDMLANMSESAEIPELSTQQRNSESQDILMEETAEAGQSHLKEEESVPETGFHPDSGVTSSEAKHLNQESDTSQEKTDEDTGSQKDIHAEVTHLARKTDWKDTDEADVKSVTEMSALIKVEETNVGDEPFEITVSDRADGIEHTDSGRSRSGSEASLEGWSEDIADSLPGLNTAEVAEQPTMEYEDQMKVDAFMLDFTAQKSRIAVKNPHVRPPKDPRSLLHRPSVDPTPSSHLPVKVAPGVPLGGLGIGIKLPGLGAGFPVLKKTQRVVRDENSPDTLSQEPETKPVEKSDTPKQDEAQHKPKWMPPRHPGFGNPLMSELKTKLKKPTKE